MFFFQFLLFLYLPTSPPSLSLPPYLISLPRRPPPQPPIPPPLILYLQTPPPPPPHPLSLVYPQLAHHIATTTTPEKHTLNTHFYSHHRRPLRCSCLTFPPVGIASAASTPHQFLPISVFLNLRFLLTPSSASPQSPPPPLHSVLLHLSPSYVRLIPLHPTPLTLFSHPSLQLFPHLFLRQPTFVNPLHTYTHSFHLSSLIKPFFS